MTNQREFVHRFVDNSEEGTLSIDVLPDAPAEIEFKVESNGNIWISASRAGWLHLARVVAELGLASYEPGYHFHVDRQFRPSSGAGPEVTFEIAD